MLKGHRSVPWRKESWTDISWSLRKTEEAQFLTQWFWNTLRKLDVLSHLSPEYSILVLLGMFHLVRTLPAAAGLSVSIHQTQYCTPGLVQDAPHPISKTKRRLTTLGRLRTSEWSLIYDSTTAAVLEGPINIICNLKVLNALIFTAH